MQKSAEQPTALEISKESEYQDPISVYSHTLGNYLGYEPSKLNTIIIDNIEIVGKKPMTVTILPGEANSTDRLVYLVIYFINQAEHDLKNSDTANSETAVISRSEMDHYINLVNIIFKLLALNGKKALVENPEVCAVLLSNARDFITLLIRCNYIEEVIAIEKHLNKIIEGILAEIPEEKLHKSSKQFSNLLNYYFILYQTELAYCFVQKKDISAALIHATDFLDLVTSPALKNHENSDCQILYHSLLSAYHLEVDIDISKARASLDKILHLKSANKSLSCTDLLAHCCNQLSTKLFLENRYAEALIYTHHEIDFLKIELRLKSIENTTIIHEQALKKVMKLGTPIRLLPNWMSDVEILLQQALKRVSFIQLKIFLTRKEALIPFLDKITLADPKPYEFDTTKQQLILYINLKHARFAKKFFSLKENPLCVEIALIGLNLFEFRKKLLAFQRLVDRQNSATLNLVAKEQVQDLSSNRINDSYSLMTEQFEQQAVARKRRPKKLKKEAVIETEKEAMVEPEPILWKIAGQSSDPHLEGGSIYSLSRKPQIPEGRWYAYVNIEAIASICKKEKQCEESVFKAIEDVLARGLITNRSQGIRFALKELQGTGYFCKIRILGEHGKGDIRVYGRIVATAKVENSKKVRQLICFDHVAFHAHKDNKLPIIQESRSSHDGYQPK